MDLSHLQVAFQVGRDLARGNEALLAIVETLSHDIQGLIAQVQQLQSDVVHIRAENARFVQEQKDFRHIPSTQLIHGWAGDWNLYLQRNQNDQVRHSGLSETTFAPFHQCGVRKQRRMMSAAVNFLRAVSNDDVKGLMAGLLESDQFLAILRMLTVPILSCPILILLISHIFLSFFLSKQIPMKPNCHISRSSTIQRLTKLWNVFPSFPIYLNLSSSSLREFSRKCPIYIIIMICYLMMTRQ